MELRHLRSFVAVAEEGHFGRAARRLYVSPPALTAHVQQLERDLGVQLLTRHPVGLTPAGSRLLDHAVRTLQEADATLAAAAPYRPPQAGSLRVGVMSNGAGDLMSAILRTFMRANPCVDVNIQALTFTDHLSAVHEGRVDVAFLRPAPADLRLAVTELVADARVAALPECHRLANASALRAEQLRDDAFVGLAEGVPASFRDYLYLAPAGLGAATRHGHDLARDVCDVLAAVAAGRGVAGTVVSFARSRAWAGVRHVPVTDAPPTMNTLVHLAEREEPVLTAFVRTTAEMAAQWRDRAL